MTANDEFIGLLEDYLEGVDGTTPLPDRVRDAIRAELPGIRQVRPRPGLRRVPSMLSGTPAIARWGLVAALTTAVALGAAILSGGSARVEPTPTATPTRVASPAPARVELRLAPSVPCPAERSVPCVQPGTYALGIGLPQDARITVPDGWVEWDYGPGSAGLIVNRTPVPADSGWGIMLMRVGDVSRDPCDPAAGTFPAKDVDTPEKLATAMASWPGFSVTDPVPTTVGDIDGELVTVTSSGSRRSCWSGSPIWRTPDGAVVDAYPMVSPVDSQTPYPAEFRIIAIDGQLIAIRTTASAATSPFELQHGVPDDPRRHASDLGSLQSILDSIKFAAAATSGTATPAD